MAQWLSALVLENCETDTAILGSSPSVGETFRFLSVEAFDGPKMLKLLNSVPF